MARAVTLADKIGKVFKLRIYHNLKIRYAKRRDESILSSKVVILASLLLVIHAGHRL